MISVVIAACNEAERIDETLSALVQPPPADIDVTVVCNGCSDDTAERARGYAGVRVIELERPSKVAALRAGDDVAVGFPRVYLDADTPIDAAAVRRIAEPLSTGPALAAAPLPAADTSGSSWPVRSFTRVWVRLPQVREGLAGRGCYAVSERGWARITPWPGVIGDDLHVDRAFHGSERVTVDSVATRVASPPTVGGLIARRARVVEGNREQGVRTSVPRSVAALRAIVAEEPHLLPDAVTFVAVSSISRLRQRWATRRGRAMPWLRGA